LIPTKINEQTQALISTKTIESTQALIPTKINEQTQTLIPTKTIESTQA
jgi:hypothetical protein